MRICFVHLGNNAPTHLWLNINRVAAMFPEIEVTLVGDSESTAETASKQGISYETYSSSPSEQDFLEQIKNQHDMDFRDGFWRYSLQRLFAAARFAEKHEDGTLHIESDILIMPDFPFSIFEKVLPKVSWQKFNESHDVASLLWFPNGNSAFAFAEQITQMEAPSHNATDMTVLNILASDNPGEYGVIPSAGQSAQLNSKIEIDEEDLINVNLFGGYFDAAAFGMWIFGQDPKNNYGFALRYQKLPHSKVQAAGTDFYLSNEGNCWDSLGNKVFSFHIHSKDKKVFSIENYDRLFFYFNSALSLRNKYIFDYAALKELVKDYRKRRMLLHLIYNMPVLKGVLTRVPFRKKIKKILRSN